MKPEGEYDKISRGRLLVFSAPSGSGKSTIIKALCEKKKLPVSFSVSATNRPPRPEEIDGRHYHFLSDEAFHQLLDAGEFVEYCEVYPGRFYGTLKQEVCDRIERGENVLLDVDVEGGMNIKRLFGDDVLSIFIMPPSVEELRKRLQNRGTDSSEKIDERIARAEYEMSMAENFDQIVENDDLESAVEKAYELIKSFIDG